MSYRSGLVVGNAQVIKGAEESNNNNANNANNDSKKERTRRNLSGRDSLLLSYLVFVMTTLTGFLIAWTVMEPPAPKAQLASTNQQVTNTWCYGSNSSFLTVIKGARIFLLILTGVVAFNNRNLMVYVAGGDHIRQETLEGQSSEKKSSMGMGKVESDTSVRTSATAPKPPVQATAEEKELQRYVSEVATILTDSNKSLAFSVFNWIFVGGILNLFGTFVVARGGDLAFSLTLGSDLFCQLVNLVLLIGIKIYRIRFAGSAGADGKDAPIISFGAGPRISKVPSFKDPSSMSRSVK